MSISISTSYEKKGDVELNEGIVNKLPLISINEVDVDLSPLSQPPKVEKRFFPQLFSSNAIDNVKDFKKKSNSQKIKLNLTLEPKSDPAATENQEQMKLLLGQQAVINAGKSITVSCE